MWEFLKRWFGGAESGTIGQSPIWSFSDAEPVGQVFRLPDQVDYELDLSTWRYRVKATFFNDDPYAESNSSYARMEYEVRRSAIGQWEVRLLGRNGLLLDQPEVWQAAPARFLNSWERVWEERQLRDYRA